MRQLVRILIALGSLLALGAEVASARDLSFEERVRAQEAIERVYYSHQIGATKPFEEAVPRALLEQKVRNYLRQSMALEKIWQRPITSEMLLKETERMARSTRMPDRLLEIYAALGNEPFLIQECVARPALAGRLARSAYEIERKREGPAAGGEEEGDALPERDAEDRTPLEKTSLERWLDEKFPGSSADSIPSVARPDAVLDVPSSRAAEGATCGPDNHWDDHSLSDVPGPRYFETAVWTGSLMVIWGGTSGDGTGFNSGGRYDPATDSWAATSLHGAPPGRYSHTAVWTGSKMIVWGGGTGAFSYQVTQTGSAYDPVADTWTPISSAGAPVARKKHTAVWTGSKMIVWGGDGTSVYNDGGLYDPVADAWTTLAAGASTPSPRTSHTAVWTGGRMVVWGGYTNSCVPNCTPTDTGGRFNPNTGTWEATSLSGAPPPRFSQLAVWTGSRMIVWGGQGTSGFVNTGGRYDPIADTWQATTLSGAPPPNSRPAVWTGSEMIVWGGGGASLGGRYNPVSDSWTPTSTAGSPLSWSASVWTGSEMIIWGSSTSNRGVRYNPASDTWIPTATSAAPDGRILHSAAWTGSLMLIWGGKVMHEDSTTALTATGGRYDPALDLWTPLSLLDAPSPRTGAAAFWTGDRMLVWGGSDATGDLNTGARYDPAGDAWAPVTLTGAPAARSGASLVWTGTEMILWGGSVYGLPWSTGGRYNPATDSWSLLPTLGALARSGHLAVWGDGVMIVWGGTDAAGSHNTGQVFDSAHQKWTSVSTAGAPAGSTGMLAAWTGNRMILWGGTLGQGARYDPYADSWSAVSAVGAPSPRSGFSLLQGGPRILVWGGYASSGPFQNTGGRYDPASDLWEPFSVDEAPDPRYQASAVWTGTSVIFWGGGTFWSYYASGGEYFSSVPGTYYPDADADGYGSDAAPLQACAPPPGYAARDGDCNDADPAIHPFAVEICNGIDENCNGLIDEGFDTDGDGYTTCGGDCNDSDPGAWYAPAEVQNLVVSAESPSVVSWDDPAPAVGTETISDLSSGSLSGTPGVDFSSAVCLEEGIGPSATDTRPDPAPGAGTWYLARARNSCGMGTYGAGSSGGERNLPCP